MTVDAELRKIWRKDLRDIAEVLTQVRAQLAALRSELEPWTGRRIRVDLSQPSGLSSNGADGPTEPPMLAAAPVGFGGGRSKDTDSSASETGE